METGDKRPISEFKLTTKQLASWVGVSQGSIYNLLSQTGRFWDVRPYRTPSGGLLWPAEEFEKFARLPLEAVIRPKLKI